MTPLGRSRAAPLDLLDYAVEAHAAFDHFWRFTFVNRHTEALLGRGRDELVGQSALTLFPALVHTRLYHEIQRVTVDRVATVCEDKLPGSTATYRLVAYPTHDGFALQATDITHERHALPSQSNDETHDHLRHLERLGALAGGLAHDFNNTLVGILGQTARLRRTAEVPTLLEPLAAIEASAERAAALVRQLSAFAGRPNAAAEPVDLAELVESVGSELAPAFGPAVEMRFVLARNVPPVPADAAQLRKLMANLLANAVEALPLAGGQIEVRTACRPVLQAEFENPWMRELPPEGDYAVIEVQDSGGGLSDEARSAIFQPHFSTKPGGRGLGLAAVLGIVRAHGGAITVPTSSNHGTMLRAFLPMYRARVSAAEAAVSPAAAPVNWQASGVVLVIDDDPGVRLVVADLLERRGLRVITATNGREGIEKADGAGAQMRGVVLDLTMPILSGQPTLERLRSSHPELPIVLMSGYDDPRSTVTSLHPDGFLPKPFTEDVFYAIVGQALRFA